jgi:hypothetical protein
MILDMNEPAIAFEGVLCFPDFTFANLPSSIQMMLSKQLLGSDNTDRSLQGSSSTTLQIASPGIVFPGS